MCRSDTSIRDFYELAWKYLESRLIEIGIEVNSSKAVIPAAEKETKDAVSRVGKLMNLPKGETPVLAIVEDKVKDKLKDQPFFDADAAKDGDQEDRTNTEG